MWIRGLVAAACVVVIAAGSLWLWQQFARTPATRVDCMAALKLWVEQDRGTEFDAYLAGCRDQGLIQLSDVAEFQ